MGEVIWRRPVAGDHARIVAVVDDWWGGRAMAAMIPRLFIDHFAETSYVVEDAQGGLVAFVIAFVSPADPTTTYVHFVGVSPTARGCGLGREVYEKVSRDARAAGCLHLKAVTSTVNLESQAFHRALGFSISGAMADYDGPGEDRVILTKVLQTRV